MATWGAVGLGGALLARVVGREIGRLTLAAACAVAGLAYGVVMDVSAWVTFSGDHSAEALLGRLALGVPFNLAHAAGNVLFCLAFGPALVRALPATAPTSR
jgi:energy-coupling factor transport system substrate-specific component